MKRQCPECDTVYDDLRCGILCPHEKRGKATCRFCGEPAICECVWPEEGFEVSRYFMLRPGDRVKRAIERLQHRPPATVVACEKQKLTIAGDHAYTVTLQIKSRLKVIQVWGESRVMVARIRACGQPVCENHLRSVTDGRAYCMDHWNAWEAVA